MDMVFHFKIKESSYLECVDSIISCQLYLKDMPKE